MNPKAMSLLLVVAADLQSIAAMDAMRKPERDEPEGKFSNSFLVGFNAYVFVFDFGMVTAEGGRSVHSRVVASAADAQEFSRALAESLGEHRKTFGSPPKGAVTLQFRRRPFEH